MRHRRFEKKGLSRDPKRIGILFKVVGLGIGLIIAFALIRDAVAATRKVLIDAPNPCHRVNKVEEDAVFLESTGETCARLIGKIPVEIDFSVKTVRIHVDGRFWKEQALIELPGAPNQPADWGGFNMEEVSEIAKRAEEMASGLKIPENRRQKEMEEKARKLAEDFHSEASEKKLAAETERLKSGLFAKQLNQAKTEETGVKATLSESRYLRSTERIYLFVSSSIPMTTLRNYAADSARLADPNISMVMRGMIGGMKTVRPTTEFVSRMIVKKTDCKVFQERCEAHKVNFLIDPLLFRKYRITQVPALVYVPHTNVIERDKSEGLTEAEGEFYVLYGDASLEYLLETLRRETKSRSLQKAVAALNNSENP